MTEEQQKLAERYVRKCLSTGQLIRLPPCLVIGFVMALMIKQHMEAQMAASDMISEGGPI